MATIENWSSMEPFVAVALAHFLALLIPGVDFFLIAQTSVSSGWRNATGVCFGISIANGVFITSAFLGLALLQNQVILSVIQVAGGVFLVCVGVVFFKSARKVDVEYVHKNSEKTWRKNFGIGFASGMLNPKNALFYLSLATGLKGSSQTELIFYGLWMFLVVLGWDILVAIVLGAPQTMRRMEKILPWLSRISGTFLMLFGVAMIVNIGLVFLTP